MKDDILPAAHVLQRRRQRPACVSALRPREGGEAFMQKASGDTRTIILSPAYLKYTTLSPALSFISSSSFPGPVRRTSPTTGFSFADSGGKQRNEDGRTDSGRKQ